MKIKLLYGFDLTTDKPCCLTCKFRGNASIAYDPARKPDKNGKIPASHRVTGVICNHPDHPAQSVAHDNICEDFDAVHQVLKRLFSTRKLI